MTKEEEYKQFFKKLNKPSPSFFIDDTNHTHVLEIYIYSPRDKTIKHSVDPIPDYLLVHCRQ